MSKMASEEPVAASRPQGAPKGRGGNSNGGGSKKGRGRRGGKGNYKRDFNDEPTGPAIEKEGILEISGKGFGFLREPEKDYRQTPDDVFVTPEIVRNFGLRDGLWINAETRMGHRGPQLTKLIDINGRDPGEVKTLPWFEELKAVNPDRRMQLETTPDRLTTRVIDLSLIHI